MHAVLDACAMIAYLRGEPGSDVVEARLAQEPPSCLAHAVNVCEVFYYFLRLGGEPAARSAVDELRANGLLICEDMDQAFWQQVGRYKVSCKVPLGDAFAIALATRFGGEIITSDHNDFDAVQTSGLCKVQFIR